MSKEEQARWAELLVRASAAQNGDTLAVMHQSTLPEGSNYPLHHPVSHFIKMKDGAARLIAVNASNDGSEVARHARDCESTPRLCPKRGGYVLMPERFRPRATLVLPGAVICFNWTDQDAMLHDLLHPKGRNQLNIPTGAPLGRIEINPTQSAHDKIYQTACLMDLRDDLRLIWTAFLPEHASVRVDEITVSRRIPFK